MLLFQNNSYQKYNNVIKIHKTHLLLYINGCTETAKCGKKDIKRHKPKSSNIYITLEYKKM